MSEKETSEEIASTAGQILNLAAATNPVSEHTYNALLAHAKRLAGSALSQRETVDVGDRFAIRWSDGGQDEDCQEEVEISPFERLKNLILADPEYAWGFHCNLAVPIMDVAIDDHKIANQAAALIMRQMFGCDITEHPNYQYEKHLTQEYFEARIEAEKSGG